MNVILAPEAIGDIEAVIQYIEQRNPQAAAELVDRVFTVIEHLATGEFDGPLQTLRSGAEVRSWPVPPLRIYYQRHADRLLVLRVYHQARRPITR